MKTLTHTIISWFLPVLIMVFTACTGTINSVRYMDASGDDTQDGKTPETAWKSLEKINSEEFGPGATILFKSGEQWSGELKPRGSGNKDNLIRIDKYGEGDKPVIHGKGGPYTIYLFNQEYWEISNLEITNFNSSEEKVDLDVWEQNGPGNVQSWWRRRIMEGFITFNFQTW